MKYQIPEVGEIEIKTIILDLNGTLSVKGVIPEGVRERLRKLKELDFRLVLLSGDQRGTARQLCEEIGLELVRCKSGTEKEAAMAEFDAKTTAAVGNARIDIGTFKKAKVRLATLQSEGIHAGILAHIDVIVPSINDALDFFLDQDTFAATMRA